MICIHTHIYIYIYIYIYTPFSLGVGFPSGEESWLGTPDAWSEGEGQVPGEKYHEPASIYCSVSV